MTIPRRPVGSKQPPQQATTPNAEPIQQQKETQSPPQPQKADVPSSVKSPEKELPTPIISTEKQLPTPQLPKMQASLPLSPFGKGLPTPQLSQSQTPSPLSSPPQKELPVPQSRKIEQGQLGVKQELKSESQSQPQSQKAQAPLPPPPQPAEKELPVPQAQKAGPEPSEAKPRLEQSLPPVPQKSASRSDAQLPSSPPQMLSPPQQTLYYDHQYQQPLKSPSESLSSLLSAYSRSSTQSVVRSSDGIAYSAVESRTSQAHSYEYPRDQGSLTGDPITEEDKESLKTFHNAEVSQQTPDTARKITLTGNANASSPPPPPPPSKDIGNQQSGSPTRGFGVGQDLGAASPPRQQIWRRRSFKGSRELPNLHLDYSHGSTASTSSISTITPAQKPLPPVKSGPSHHNPGKASTSRSAEPAERELASQPPAKDKQKMGHGTSKMRQLKNKFHISRRSDDSTKSSKSDQTGPMVNRPPTPEYRKEDVKTPVVSTFISPVSPASSPEPPHNDSLDMSKDHVDRQSETPLEAEAKPAARRTAHAPAPSLQLAKSLPDLKTKAPPVTHEPMPPASAYPNGGRNSPAPDAAPRGRQQGPPGAMPPSRNTSARPSSRGSVRPGAPGRFSGPEPEARWARSASGDLCYKGRDGTLYPEMKEDLNDPDPKAMQFPMKTPDELPPLGAVFKAMPLKDSHFNCYQRHKTMLRRANKRYPLACQVCEKQDSEDRFSCNFCYVKMCTSCLEAFETKGRDLKALQTELANNGPLSLSSTTRPGSALGLQITF